MTRLVLPAFAKINLGLQIVGRRPDGFHELRTVYQTISLRDTIVFERPARSLSLETTGLALPAGGDNLILRAAETFMRATGRRTRARITLRKRIPIGAGLGGGSSDAAVTLLAMNRLQGFPLDRERLVEMAAGLGSDVPFFLSGGTALGLGRGEIVRPLRDLEPRPVLLLIPRFGISTAEAFRRADTILTPRHGQTSIYRFARQRVRGTGLRKPAPNDLEHAVAPIHPHLRRLLQKLWAADATVAAMTGSGSAVYGFFAGERQATRALRVLTEPSPLASAWLGRTVGTAEYSARLLSP